MATTQRSAPITLTLTDQAAVEVRKFIAEEKVAPETAGLRIVLHGLRRLPLLPSDVRARARRGLFVAPPRRCARST